MMKAFPVRGVVGVTAVVAFVLPPAAARATSGYPTALGAADIRRLSADATMPVVVFLRGQHQSAPRAASVPATRDRGVAAAEQPIVDELHRLRTPSVRPFQLAGAIATTVSPAERQRLVSNPDVLAVLPDSEIALREAGPGPSGPDRPLVVAPPSDATQRVCPADPSRPLLEPEGLELVHARSSSGQPAANDLADGTGVRVGILGGPVDVNAPELRRGGSSVIAAYRDFTGLGTAAPSRILESFGDASTIGAQGNQTYDVSTYVNPAHPLPAGCTMRIEGVAPGASLYVAKVFSGVAAPTSAVLQGIEWAVLQEHVDVLNESLVVSGYPDTALDALRMFNDAAVAAGVSVVVAAGDAGNGNTIGSPATGSNVIAVGATTALRTYAQLGYGGYPLGKGGWLDDNISALSSSGVAQSAPRTVDLVAPGDAGWAACSTDVASYPGCVSFVNGVPSPFFFFSGTSQAAPFVSGAAALVIQAYRESHRGASPAPDLVKEMLMSSSTDLGAPAGEQGAGLLNALHAVELAESLGAPTGTHEDAARGAVGGPSPQAGDLLVAPGAIGLTENPGSPQVITLSLTNAGASSISVRPTARNLEPESVVAEGSVALGPGSPLHFSDADGTSATATAVTFAVPPGADRLAGSVAWQPASSPSPVVLTVLDPAGRIAAYSLPLGNGGVGHVDVVDPAPGHWTALVWSRSQGSAHPENVSYRFVTAAFREAPVGGSLRLRPGQTRTWQVCLDTPSQPGDVARSILLRVGGTVAATVPVVMRSIVPVGPDGAHFEGAFVGGNGLLVGGVAGGEFHSYQFDLPANKQDLSVALSIDNPGSELWGFLVDPHGMPLTARSNRFSAPSGQNLELAALHLSVPRPEAGRWTVVVVLNGASSSGRVIQRFAGHISFDAVRTHVAGLPRDEETLLSGNSPHAVTVTVTNATRAPAAYFVDARLDSTAPLSLRSMTPTTYSTPDTPLDAYPQFLVPPHTTRLDVTASSTVPLALDTQPYWGAAFYVGDPDVPGTPGRKAHAQVTGPELAPTTWVCDANPLGPFTVEEERANVECAARAETDAFDPAVTSSTGDFWLSATEPTPPSFRPLVLQPGQTGTISISISPTQAAGQTVSGFLDIDSWDPVVHFGTELVEIPYAYTVG
jgi:hypothetical protein